MVANDITPAVMNAATPEAELLDLGWQRDNLETKLSRVEDEIEKLSTHIELLKLDPDTAIPEYEEAKAEERQLKYLRRRYGVIPATIWDYWVK